MSETDAYEELLQALTLERFAASAGSLREADVGARKPNGRGADGAVPPVRHLAGPDSGPGRLLLRVEEAAQMLDVGRTRIYDLIGSGALQSIKIGGSRRIPTAALQRYVDALMDEDM